MGKIRSFLFTLIIGFASITANAEPEGNENLTCDQILSALHDKKDDLPELAGAIEDLWSRYLELYREEPKEDTKAIRNVNFRISDGVY